MKDFIAFLNEHGFVFQGSKIYGGMSNSWDFGPLGVELKRNIKNIWWKRFVQQEQNVEGLDSSIILSPKVWKASGHLKSFSDPLIDCKECKTRYRADKIIEDALNLKVEGKTFNDLEEFINKNNIKCPKCNEQNYTGIRNFNLMFKTEMSVIDTKDNYAYLRPETAQGIFINMEQVAKVTKQKLPFGIGQIGKAFRNEITPGNFIFRTKEFEQMELEFFFDASDKKDWFKYFVDKTETFFKELGLNAKNYFLREHKNDELSHYSLKTVDYEYNFPFGKKELCGIANRGNYDINAHNSLAQEKQFIRNDATNEMITPLVIEPSFGVERLMLALLLDGYVNDEREILKLSPKIAPVKVAILPLMPKFHGKKAAEIHKRFLSLGNVKLVEKGTIGKRYKRQDKIGTPFCITIDDDSLKDDVVTIRFRDDTSQQKLSVEKAIELIEKEIKI